jgi:hypothetical protein
VVDSGAEKVHLFIRHIDPFRQHLARALHRMAQPHVRAPAAGAHRPAVGCHRVHIVQQQRIRRQLIQVVAQVQQHRDGAQRAEHPAGSQRIAHALLHPVLAGDIDIQRIRLQPALLEGGDHVVCFFHAGAPVERGFHFGFQAALLDERLHQRLRLLQPPGVDIHQADGAVLQGWRQQDIVAQIARENNAARADQRNFCHIRLLFRIFGYYIWINPMS